MLMATSQDSDCRDVIRARNAMTPEMRKVHAALERWGKWARDGLSNLGYPRRAITERFGEGGILAGSPRPPTDMPDDIALVDRAIAHLGVIDQGVIRIYYMTWAPPETMWKQCTGIRSFSNFKAVLKRARWRISLTISEGTACV